MKKVISCLAIFTLILSILMVPVSAETKSLLPADASKWGSVAAGGENATVTIENGATVISGSAQSWPCATYDMDTANQITVPVAGTVLEYDFSLDVGSTNISIFMKGETPKSFDKSFFSIVKCIESSTKDAESGDLTAGAYKGTITLDQIVAHEDFPDAALNADGTLTISGIEIFTVFGAKVVVNKMNIVTGGTSSESSAATSSEATSSEATSSVVNNETSNTSSTTSSVTANTSSTVSKATSSVSVTTSSQVDDNSGLDTIWYVVIGVAAVAIIIVIAVITKKKK